MKKFTLVLALVTLCLCVASIAADTSDSLPNPDQEIEQDDLFFNPFGWLKKLFSGFYKVLKKTLRTVKGANCSIKSVLDIKQTALNFPNDVKSCGDIANKQLKKVLNDVNNALSDSVNILNYQTTICSQIAATNEGGKTSTKCYSKLLSTFWDLYLETSSAIDDANNVKGSFGDSGDCVQNVLANLKSKFTNFSSNIKTCSKLI